MKLRNKKTGGLANIMGDQDFFRVYTDAGWHDYDSLAELNEEWEDYKQKEEKPKRYRLKKDLPTFKAGDEFFTDPYGSLWLDQEIDGEPNSSRVMAYNHSTLEKFPNILENWFEPIEPAEPLIKDEKIRKAVRAWAEAQGLTEVYLASNGYEIYGGIDDWVMQFKGEPFPFADNNKIYTIDELCGEEEE